MRTLYRLGMLALLTLAPSVANAEIRIADDRGGRIGTYMDKYKDLQNSGETVVVDGLCASACTIVLAALPPESIRVTDRAKFGFHAAWDFGPGGRQVTNPEATKMLYDMYPTAVRRWIAARGGLTPKMIFLRGNQLAGMYGVRTKSSYTGQAYAAAPAVSRASTISSGIPESDQAKY